MTRTCNLQAAATGLTGPGPARLASLRSLVWLLVLWFASFVAMPAAQADDDMPLDYQVKAAFLVNFPKYVDWPATAFKDTNSPITVGIFGDDNVANEFAPMIE